MTPQPEFTARGIASGFRIGLPVMASGFVYGLAFGSLAAAKGLSLLETVLMSLVVFSGSAQVAVVQIWPSSANAIAAAMIVIVANIRYLLMSAALRPWLQGLSPIRLFAVLGTLVDSAFALGMRSRADGKDDAGIMLGSSLASYAGWVSATAVGYLFGQVISNPRAIGLDFVIISFCVAAAAVMARHIKRFSGLIAPLGATVAIVLVDRLYPGPWIFVVAAGVAAVIAAVLYDPEKDTA